MEQALQLIQQYIDGWKQNDYNKIIVGLSQGFVKIESHGSTYYGIGDMQRWFDLRLQAKSAITKWDILTFYYIDHEQTAFFEWDFSCISNNIEYAFSDISLIKFGDGKIKFIHEYRMTYSCLISGMVLLWHRTEFFNT